MPRLRGTEPRCAYWVSSSAFSLRWVLQGLQYPSCFVQVADAVHCACAGSLGWQAFARFGGWLVVSAAVYVLYSMHRAEAKEIRDAHT